MRKYTLEQQVQVLHSAGQSIRGIASILNIDKSKVQRILSSFQNASPFDDTLNSDTPHESRETRGEFFTETLLDTSETVSDTPFDTLNDTGKTAYETPTDTPLDTANRFKTEEKHRIKQPVSVTKAYTLAETKLLMKQMALLEADIHDFTSEMVNLHEGGTSIMLPTYLFYLRRAQRLIQSTKLLADQLEENCEDLLVTQVLLSLQAAIENALSGEHGYSEGEIWLELEEIDTTFWQQSVRSGFLHPSA